MNYILMVQRFGRNMKTSYNIDFSPILTYTYNYINVQKRS